MAFGWVDWVVKYVQQKQQEKLFKKQWSCAAYMKQSRENVHPPWWPYVVGAWQNKYSGQQSHLGAIFLHKFFLLFFAFSWVFFPDIDVQHPAHLGKIVLNFWPWEYCYGWVYMKHLKESSLSDIDSLVQPVELKFWDDININFLFGKITVYF